MFNFISIKVILAEIEKAELNTNEITTSIPEGSFALVYTVNFVLIFKKKCFRNLNFFQIILITNSLKTKPSN